MPKRWRRYSIRVPSWRSMGCGVTIANPSSGGVMRCRLVASAKNAKTWSRGSGSDIEVRNVCNPGIGLLFDSIESIARRCLTWNSMVEGMDCTHVEYYRMREHEMTQAIQQRSLRTMLRRLAV